MTENNQKNIAVWETRGDLSSLIKKRRILRGVKSYVAGIDSDPTLIAGVANKEEPPGEDPFF